MSRASSTSASREGAGARPAGRRRARRGQVLVLYALAMTGLLGMVGLAVDWGMLIMTQSHYQKVADTCVTVAAQGLLSGAVNTRGNRCVQNNNVPASATIAINNPPSVGPNQNGQFVELIIDSDEPTYFMKVFNIDTAKVRVRAVAGGFRLQDYAIMGLQPDTDAVRSSGGASSNIIGNACSRGDFRVSGTLNITGYAVANGVFDGTPNAAGFFSNYPDLCLDPLYPLPFPFPPLSDTSTLSGTVAVTGAACPAQPNQVVTRGPAQEVSIRCPNAKGLVRVIGPVDKVDVGGANDAQVELVGPNATFRELALGGATGSNNGTGTITLAPGWYDKINVHNQANVVLAPGLFMINSEYDQSGGGSLSNTVTGGQGVSLVIGHKFELSGNSDVNLTCCANGMQNNVLIYHVGGPIPGSPWGASDSNQIRIRGNSSNRTFNGTIYSPFVTPDSCSNCIEIEGNARNMVVNGQLIANQVRINGTGLTVNFPGNSGAARLRPYLAE